MPIEFANDLFPPEEPDWESKPKREIDPIKRIISHLFQKYQSLGITIKDIRALHPEETLLFHRSLMSTVVTEIVSSLPMSKELRMKLKIQLRECLTIGQEKIIRESCLNDWLDDIEHSSYYEDLYLKTYTDLVTFMYEARCALQNHIELLDDHFEEFEDSGISAPSELFHSTGIESISDVPFGTTLNEKQYLTLLVDTDEFDDDEEEDFENKIDEHSKEGHLVILNRKIGKELTQKLFTEAGFSAIVRLMVVKILTLLQFSQLKFFEEVVLERAQKNASEMTKQFNEANELGQLHFFHLLEIATTEHPHCTINWNHSFVREDEVRLTQVIQQEQFLFRIKKISETEMRVSVKTTDTSENWSSFVLQKELNDEIVSWNLKKNGMINEVSFEIFEAFVQSFQFLRPEHNNDIIGYQKSLEILSDEVVSCRTLGELLSLLNEINPQVHRQSASEYELEFPSAEKGKKYKVFDDTDRRPTLVKRRSLN